MAMAERDEKELITDRARESVSGWWGRSRRFLAEVRNETGRVTWPSRKEVYATTIVVNARVGLWCTSLAMMG